MKGQMSFKKGIQILVTECTFLKSESASGKFSAELGNYNLETNQKEMVVQPLEWNGIPLCVKIDLGSSFLCPLKLTLVYHMPVAIKGISAVMV